MSKIPLLFEILKERKITQAKLSKDTGLSSGSIGDWKSGRSKPSHEAMIILCQYLNLPLDFFDEKQKNVPGKAEDVVNAAIENSVAESKFRDMLNDMSTEDVAEILNYARYLRWRRNQAP